MLTGDAPLSDRPARILVADDDADIRELVALTLERGGYEVRQVSDGGAAFAATRLWRPDLVLLDVNMPAMSGMDVLRAIRRDPDVSTTRVIMVTSQATRTEMSTGMTAGADDYVLKPFSPADLLQHARTVLAM